MTKLTDLAIIKNLFVGRRTEARWVREKEAEESVYCCSSASKLIGDDVWRVITGVIVGVSFTFA